MLTVNPINRRDWLLLALILFAAALMRFSEAGIVEFFHDDAMVSSLAQDMVTGGGLPVRGINSSTGIPNPPTSIYVMALPFAIDLNPMTAIYFVMGFNVLGVGLLWLIAQRYFGRYAALIAGLTYAISPWAVLYSRKIWAQEYHTPFVLFGILLALYGFWEANQRGDQPKRGRWLSRHEWAQVFSLPVLLFGFQIHFAAWALLPMYGLILLIAFRRISWRALVISAGLCSLVITPYLIGIYDTYQRYPERLRPDAVGTLADESQGFSALSLEYITYLATGFGLETWIAPEQQAQMLTAVPPVTLWWIIGGMVLLGSFVLLRKQHRRFWPVIIWWAFAPAIALIPQWTGVFPHYFIASIPALAMLAGIGVAWVASVVPLEKTGASIILGSFAVILLTQGMYWRGVLRFIDATAIQYPGFTVPLHYLQAVESAVSDYDDVLVLSDGMAWDLHHESVVWPVMLRDTASCTRTLIGDGYAVFPTGEFAVIQAPNMPPNALDNLYITDDPQVFAGRGENETYRVHTFDTAPEWNGAPITPIEPVRYDGDVLLTGYHLSESLLLLEWQLPAATAGLDYQYSGQFMAANGEKIGQQDATFWHGRHWCAGDRLLTWTFTDVPADTSELRVFLYQLGDATTGRYINANVLDETGNPMGQFAAIALNE